MRNFYKRSSFLLLLFFVLVHFKSRAQVLNWPEADQFGILAGDKIIASDAVFVKGSVGSLSSIDPNVTATRDFLDNGQGNVAGALNILQDNINYCNGLSGQAINSSLGGQVLEAGVYEINSPALLATGDHLELKGDSTSVFVFNINGELTLESLSGIKIGDVRPGNIYWNVHGKIFIQPSVRAFGVFMSDASIYKTGINFGKATLFALQGIDISIGAFNGIGHKEFYSVEEMLRGTSAAKIINCPEQTFATISQLALPYYPNLVSNSSFEDMFRCPTGFNAAGTGFNSMLHNYSDVCHWFSVLSPIVNLAGTSDYFNSCSNVLNEMDVPDNAFGHQTAHNGGGAYTGFYAFVQPNPTNMPYDYREYLRQELAGDRALVAHKRYYGEYYVSLSDQSAVAVNNIGMAVTKSAPTFLTDWIISDPNQPAQIQYSGSPITDKTDWTRVSGSFVASGGETFITIGNFNNTATTLAGSTIVSGAATDQSYYLVDNVGLYELPDAGESIVLAACNDKTSFTLGRGRPLPLNINPTYEWTADTEPNFSANTLFVTVSPLRPTVYTLTIKAHGEVISVTSARISGVIALGAPKQITTISAGLPRFNGTVTFTGDYHVLGPLELVGGEFNTEPGTVFDVDPENGVEATKLKIYEFAPYLTQHNGQTYPTIIKVGRTSPGQITKLYLNGTRFQPSLCTSREKWGGLHLTDGAQIFTENGSDPKNPGVTLKTVISEAYVGVGSSQLSGTAKTVNTNRYIFKNTVFQKCDYGFWDMCKQNAATANEGIIECTFDANGTGVLLEDEPMVGGFQIGGNYALAAYKGNDFTGNVTGFSGQANQIVLNNNTFNNSDKNLNINSVDNVNPAQILVNTFQVHAGGKGIVSNGNATITGNILTGVPGWQGNTGIQMAYSTMVNGNTLKNLETGLEVATNVYDQITIKQNIFSDNLTGVVFSAANYPTIPTGGNVPPSVSCNTFTAANVPGSYSSMGIYMRTGVRMVKPTAVPPTNRLGGMGNTVVPGLPGGNYFEASVTAPLVNEPTNDELTYFVYQAGNNMDLPPSSIAINNVKRLSSGVLVSGTPCVGGVNPPGVLNRVAGKIAVTSTTEEIGVSTFLKQAFPNPAREEVSIAYRLPVNCQKASVVIREIMTGKIVKTFELTPTDAEELLRINLQQFNAGLYAYTLFADSSLIASKILVIEK
jgi:hypothetical protein